MQNLNLFINSFLERFQCLVLPEKISLENYFYQQKKLEKCKHVKKAFILYLK